MTNQTVVTVITADTATVAPVAAHMSKVWAKEVALVEEMSPATFGELLATLVKAEETTAETLKVLFNYSLNQLVAFERTTFINQLVAAVTPRNRSLIVTVTGKCSLFKFDRKAGVFAEKRTFKDDAQGLAAENAAIEYAEQSFNFFETECEGNIWAWDATTDKPKLAKAAVEHKPVAKMVNAMRSNLLDCENVADMLALIEQAKAEFVKEFEFTKATAAKNPDMDKASIAKLYKKSQEK